jgi:hypothetical protein
MTDWLDLSDDEIRTRLTQRGFSVTVTDSYMNIVLAHARDGCEECENHLQEILDR